MDGCVFFLKRYQIYIYISQKPPSHITPPPPARKTKNKKTQKKKYTYILYVLRAVELELELGGSAFAGLAGGPYIFFFFIGKARGVGYFFIVYRDQDGKKGGLEPKKKQNLTFFDEFRYIDRYDISVWEDSLQKV